MKRSEYTDRVLAAMRRVTAAERATIRAELDAHMEDHMDALLALGYEPDLAEQRTMERMGDPEEVGRELDKQYPRRWLLIGRAAMVLTVVFALLMLLPFGQLLKGTVQSNLRARFWPTSVQDITEISFVGYVDGAYHALTEEAVDPGLMQTADGVTVRVYQVGLEDAAAAETTAWVAFSVSMNDPFQKPSQYIAQSVKVNGEEITGHTFHWPWFSFIDVPVERGEEFHMTCGLYGKAFDFVVPLPWKEGEA